MGYTVVVVITQNKSDSLKAIEKAITVAKGVQSSKLRLVYMFPIASGKPTDSLPFLSQEQLINESDAAFQEFLPILEKENISFEKYISIGNLLHEVRIQVQMGRCQLLVLSPNQVQELFGDAPDIEQRLTCPVLYAS